MFALEINFNDGVSPPETLLVRRPHAIVGTSDFAHVVVEGASSIPCEIKISRGLGREFNCQPVKKPGAYSAIPPFLEGVYQNQAQFSLGEVSIHVTALDLDLQYNQGETIERAGVKVLRAALAREAPLLPAVAVVGATPICVSFWPGVPLLVGRSRKCGLRLDSSGVSGEHARIGFEQGVFWVEDLGSTNGTFVGSERISGRRQLRAKEQVIIGNEFVLAGLSSKEELSELSSQHFEAPTTETEIRYPCLVTTSGIPRPSRLVIPLGKKISIGRDPASDIWVGAPHISRTHCEVSLDFDGRVSVVDLSTNGTYLDGTRMIRGEHLPVSEPGAVIDLKEGVSFAFCFDADAEEELLDGLRVDSSESETGSKYSALSGSSGRYGDDSLTDEIDQAAEQLIAGGAFRDVVRRWSKDASNSSDIDSENLPASKGYFPRKSKESADIEALTARYDLDDIQTGDLTADYPKLGIVGWLVGILMLVVLVFIGVLIFSSFWR